MSKPIMKALIAATMLSASIPHIAKAQSFEMQGTAGSQVTATTVAKFDQPWAMTFLPDNSLLITTKPGRLFRVLTDGSKHEILGVPEVAYGGQGGLGDVIAHPDFAQNKLVYLSYVEIDGAAQRGAVVVRAQLDLDANGAGRLTKLETIWKQSPKTSGRGHFSHRLVFGPNEGAHAGKLFITSGDRQEQTPAQDFALGFGKIIRLNDDGTIPVDNPWSDGSKGEMARTFWSMGHRNMLGIAFDASGRLWATEMGPRHGDELNLIEKGANYGWPLVSEGKHYSGQSIPSHASRSDFVAPKAFWVPSIAPAGLVIYSGKTFPQWNGNAFIGGLVSRALIRVKIDNSSASEAERFNWPRRIREVEQGPDGDLWILEDQDGAGLLRISK